ncbi:hypothetical protein KGF56_001760 [Candida oxycetoniae]|uniref:Thioredoxin domain-containing protein n=1 Tax=Candida oxycetoniae TaxID=497107 RepID=A0AAI9SZE0_9ASCO|nr:uncharacterized protein KGF56_001760 [Candida oxycetoniae]KAI3405416.2 hypothetical protein KGF56_001760 [Candida oxycetoniae]
MLQNIQSKQQFTSALQNKNDMIVLDFFDECNHCSNMNNKLDEFSDWYETQNKHVKFYKCNVEKEKELADDYSVSSIPTTLFFKKGKLIDKVIGPEPNEIKRVIDSDLM